MIVFAFRGDHTSVDFFMAVVPPRTECIVFSIDGSFTASVSVSGRDPKVRPGAVDVVRYFELLYIHFSFNFYILIREDIRFMQNVTPLRFCQMSTF